MVLKKSVPFEEQELVCKQFLAMIVINDNNNRKRFWLSLSDVCR